ncbi:hypothetical protein BHM03_00013332 [Ensete ventricosum]|nr:hypothetical protein BHM03_00013332 [Ensete ventricosum]
MTVVQLLFIVILNRKTYCWTLIWSHISRISELLSFLINILLLRSQLLLWAPLVIFPQLCLATETAYTTRKSKESDVYSYGVVLLELLTRKKALDSSFPENMDIVNWVTSTLDGNGKIGPVVDQDLLNQVMGTLELEEVHKVLFLAMKCTAKEASRRPSMQNVVRELIDINTLVSKILYGNVNFGYSVEFLSA